MPRPKKPAHLKVKKESFSAPIYVIDAAKKAAGAPEKEFSPWLVAAIKGKLVRENPGLLEQMRSELETPAVEISSNVAQIETDANGLITSCNAAFIELCGHTFDEVLGRKPGDVLQGPLSEPSEIARMRAAISAREPVTVRITNYHKSGAPYGVHLSIRPTRTGFAADATPVKEDASLREIEGSGSKPEIAKPLPNVRDGVDTRTKKPFKSRNAGGKHA